MATLFEKLHGDLMKGFFFKSLSPHCLGKIARVIWIVLGFHSLSNAQSFDLGSWNILQVRYQINDRYNLFGEAQIRSLQFYDNFHYYEYKGGVNYKLGKNVHVALGAGNYQTYLEGGNFVLPKSNDELRLWPQLLVFQKLGGLKIEHRVRTEFRYSDRGNRERYRYRLGISYPFGKENKDGKQYLISVSNELFFSQNIPYFERNRLLLAFNYKVNENTTLQMGYIHQGDYRVNDETGRDFLVLGIYLDLFRK